MTICPCCGAKNQEWTNGCAACGVKPVGEALPRPEHQLPSFGRALLLTVTGVLSVLTFITFTVGAFAQNVPTSKTYTEAFVVARGVVFDFWNWIAAAETAAWRLKWVAIPVTFLVLFGTRKIYHSIKQSPAQFCGLGYARTGYIASAAVPLMIAILIGVTVPERLRQRQMAIEAGFKAQGYRIARALLEYREQFGTLPSDLKDLNKLPDRDGTLAEALHELDSATYKPIAEVAAVPKKKPQQLQGAVIRNASLDPAADSLNEGFSFTNYELPLPGYDKKLGTEDDLVIRDGVIYSGIDVPNRNVNTRATSEARRP